MITGSVWRIALTVVFVAAALVYAVRARDATGWQPKGAWSLHALAAAVMAGMLWPAGMAVSPLLYLLFFTACGLFIVYVGMFGSVAHWPYHAAMMATMAAMPVMMSTPAVAAPMPAMSQHDHMAMAAGPVLGSATPVWLRASAAAVAGVLFVSALWWFYVLIRGPERPYSDLLMAIGMGACFALLV